jgi:hypothetical protein
MVEEVPSTFYYDFRWQETYFLKNNSCCRKAQTYDRRLFRQFQEQFPKSQSVWQFVGRTSDEEMMGLVTICRSSDGRGEGRINAEMAARRSKSRPLCYEFRPP